jgi:hypothetical protein
VASVVTAWYHTPPLFTGVYCHHRAEPQASANHDLTRIVFTSNWGRSGTDQVEMYLIDLPADWAER